MPMMNDLCVNVIRICVSNQSFHSIGFAWHLAFQPYGDAWKKRRAILHQEFQGSSLLQHRPHQLESARTFLRRLLQTPDDFMEHLRQ